MSNKLTTQGYFIKRLKDSGYEVWKVFDKYGDMDIRRWTVLLDPGIASVYCTCCVNSEFWEESYFELSDGGQYIPHNFKIRTDSIEVFVSYLVKYGINNKRGNSIK